MNYVLVAAPIIAVWLRKTASDLKDISECLCEELLFLLFHSIRSACSETGSVRYEPIYNPEEIRVNILYFLLMCDLLLTTYCSLAQSCSTWPLFSLFVLQPPAQAELHELNHLYRGSVRLQYSIKYAPDNLTDGTFMGLLAPSES